jgi:hypothetical protein
MLLLLLLLLLLTMLLLTMLLLTMLLRRRRGRGIDHRRRRGRERCKHVLMWLPVHGPGLRLTSWMLVTIRPRCLLRLLRLSELLLVLRLHLLLLLSLPSYHLIVLPHLLRGLSLRRRR